MDSPTGVCIPIYPTSVGPSSGQLGDFGTIPGHQISDPFKLPYKTSLTVSGTLGFGPQWYGLEIYPHGVNSHRIRVDWVYSFGPPYARIEFTGIPPFNDPTFPWGEWAIEVIPTINSTATINYTMGPFRRTYVDPSFNVPDPSWCNISGRTLLSGNFNVANYTNWVTAVL